MKTSFVIYNDGLLNLKVCSTDSHIFFIGVIGQGQP